ncbi:hypothetical protein B0H12DRAFT_1240560 [Mycena haematopus]|nr:hypothetical protein B0H12DRAFT_1240560 [Mycena haematopus]
MLSSTPHRSTFNKDLDEFLSLNTLTPSNLPILQAQPQDPTPRHQSVLTPPKIPKPPPPPKPPIWSSLVANKRPDWVELNGEKIYWWDYIVELNSVSLPKHITLKWSRACATCNIKILQHADNKSKSCFICGPEGAHFVEPLPDPPEQWAPLLADKRLSGLSQKLNNVFCLTALGVHDGDFMKFPSGVSSVTLNSGRTYHRIIPTTEGDHAMCWFIHDPSTFHQNGKKGTKEWEGG